MLRNDPSETIHEEKIIEIYQKLELFSSAFAAQVYLGIYTGNEKFAEEIFNIKIVFDEFRKNSENKYFTKKYEHSSTLHLTQEGSTFIREKIINQVERAIKGNSTSDLTPLYEILVIFFKIFPRNRKDPKFSDISICPITLEPLWAPENRIVLSTGYQYDKKALLKWIEISHKFTDPVSEAPLPQFDIDRIVALQHGLQKIVSLKETFEKEKNQLLKQQRIKFGKKDEDLLPGDRIKKCFLEMTHKKTRRSSKKPYKLELQKLIESQDIKQQETVPQPTWLGKPRKNFSNLNLSGLCFSGNDLTGPGNLDLRGANLSQCTFLGECNTDECMHADLTGANLEGARFLNSPGKGICIKTTDFTRANLKNVDFTGVGNWNDVDLTEANLTGAFLYKKSGKKVSGQALKKHLAKKSLVKGLETAIFEEPKIKQEPVIPIIPAPAPEIAPVPVSVPQTPVNNFIVPPTAPEFETPVPVDDTPALTPVYFRVPVSPAVQAANLTPVYKKLPSSVQAANRTPTFDDFRKAYYKDFNGNPYANPFSTMHLGLLFGFCKTMKQVESYANKKPDSRTHRILAGLKR